MIRNLDAEMAVVGCALAWPEVLDDLAGLLPTHLSEPPLARLLAGMLERRQKGLPCDAVGMAGAIGTDPAWKELGGAEFVARVMNDGCGPDAIPDYAALLIDLSQRRDIARICQEGAAQAANIQMHDGLEAGTIACQIEGQLLAVLDSRTSGLGQYAGRAAGDVVTQLRDRVEGRGEPLRTFGLPEIDERLGPIGRHDVIILGGRTSMGKSAVAQQLACMIAEQGMGVCFFAFEMSSEQMGARMLSAYCSQSIPYSQIARQDVDRHQIPLLERAAEKVAALPMVLDHSGAKRPSQVIAMCRRARRSFEVKGVKLGLIVLDHIGLMDSDEPASNDYARMSSVARSLKKIAKALDCPVLACTQINRAGENRENNRPTRSDLRDSGHIEEIADAIILCYREVYYLERNPPKFEDAEKCAEWESQVRAKRNDLELIFDKVRMGSTGVARLWFDPATTALKTRRPYPVQGAR